jgi:hypothetical protein
VAGAGIGAMVKSERWEALPWAAGPPRRAEVPLGGPLSLSVATARRAAPSALIGLSLGF